MLVPHQVHGTTIKVIDELLETVSEDLESVDALITNKPDICIGVNTADCIPILLYDYKNSVIAAVHAGWRGTVEQILLKTLLKMKELFQSDGDNIIACIGPGISLTSFEVGDEVYETFQGKGFDMDKISILNKETGKYHIDLVEANRIQLTGFGIPQSQIESTNICTYQDHETFFSARRLGIKSGRMLSGIMIKCNNKI